MTDAEIIKALEMCSNIQCKWCPLVKTDYCTQYLTGEAFDLIKRQQAEIERLHNILLSFTDEVHTWSNKKGYDTTELSLIPILNKAESVRKAIIAEAVKEFAERLKEYQRNYSSGLGGFADELVDRVLRNAIEIVKEGGINDT